MSNDHSVDFALASATSPMGKCTSEFKCSVPDELYQELQFLATANGLPLAAYVRDVLTDHAMGRGHVIRLLIKRPLRSTS